MDSPARHRLQVPFEKVQIGERFQMVNNVMKAAIPGSVIFTKIDETTADSNGSICKIRSDWPCEIIN